MARIHGRNGRFYLSPTSGAAASPLAFLSAWSITWTQEYSDVTPLGAAQRAWLPGAPDISGTFSGWYDDASLQGYTAVVDGLPRSFYLYPNASTPTQYFQGVIEVIELDSASGVTAGATVSGSWVTNIAVTRIDVPFTTVTAGLAAAAGAAGNASIPSVGSVYTSAYTSVYSVPGTVTAGLAAATGRSINISPSGATINAPAGLASASGAALAPVSFNNNAPAGLASASGTALPPAFGRNAPAGLASASGWAAVNQATGTVHAGLASATAAAPFVPGSVVSLTLTAQNPVRASGWAAVN